MVTVGAWTWVTAGGAQPWLMTRFQLPPPGLVTYMLTTDCRPAVVGSTYGVMKCLSAPAVDPSPGW